MPAFQPQRLPSQLTYNDLNGQEATDILCDWFRQLLKSHPLMQPHLTLPMAVLSLDIKVGVDMHVGGTVPVASAPEHLDIAGKVSLRNELAAGASHVAGARGVAETASSPELRHIEDQTYSALVNAAPLPGGQPPDQIRDQHSLPVPRPGYGARETGSHLFLADIPDVPDAMNADIGRELRHLSSQPAEPPPDLTGGRRGEVAEGYVFSAEVVTSATQPLHQQIPVDQGAIEIDLAGKGIAHAGMLVKERDHRASVKSQGDNKGSAYSSVNGVYDPGPAGLMTRSMTGQGGGGLGSDGRSRISFGNSHRG